MRTVLLCLSVMALVPMSVGAVWTEDGDAPALLPGQTTVGPGALTAIAGSLSSGTDVDLYAILIDDYQTFSASTCGGTSIDSCLYLFDEYGNGVAMSEDACGTQSTITSAFVTGNGHYYLAMTAYDYDPLNDGGLEIWNDAPWGEERAPDGPGAPGPLASWGGSAGGSGAYTIAVTGASFAQEGPPPATGACCFTDGRCQVMTEAACIGLGGSYYGDETTCDPNPCPEPLTGACCFGTGGCLALTESMCVGNGGTYQGDDSVCWPNPCVAGSTEWREDFDGYDAGTLLDDVGGWFGWDNNPSAAGTVSDDESRSAPHSVVVKGTADAVHPFNVEGGRWEITAWQYIPSDLDAVTYFVVNSYYQHGGPYYWAVELHFDPATDVVYDYMRDPDATSGVPIVYDQWVEIRINAYLESGLGEIEQYYNDQLVYSGDWITGSVGQLAIGAIDLYAPHQASVYYDDLSLVPLQSTPLNPVRPLFTGVEYGELPTRTTDLSGFPEVTWNNGFTGAVSAAAGRPDGSLYLANGAFTSTLYLAPLEGPMIELCELQEDVSGLAYGKGRLWGYSNYSGPAIWEINPATGAMTSVLSTGTMRFFGLDYNAADGLLYGYTEYGSPTGLYAIDIDEGTMTHVADRPDVDNAAGRGLACGYNKVYVQTVYGATTPMFVYDLAQGIGGEWVAMTHPYPESNSTSGAAWIPGPVPGDANCDGVINNFDIDPFVLMLTNPEGYEATYLDCTLFNGDINLDGAVNNFDIDGFVDLLTGK